MGKLELVLVGFGFWLSLVFNLAFFTTLNVYNFLLRLDEMKVIRFQLGGVVLMSLGMVNLVFSLTSKWQQAA